MYIVYVLQDEAGKFYKGMTNDLKRRLREHRSGQTITTARMRNLSLAYKEEFNSFDEAKERELYFKSAAGRRFLKKVIKN